MCPLFYYTRYSAHQSITRRTCPSNCHAGCRQPRSQPTAKQPNPAPSNVAREELQNPKTIRRRCFLALLLFLPQSQEITRTQKQPPRHISSKLAAWDVTKYLRLDWLVCRRSINTSPAWRNSTRHHQGCESSDPSFLHAYIHVHVPFSPPLGSFAVLGLMVISIH